MADNDHDRRRILQWLAVLPMAAGLVRPASARAQAPAPSPVRVDTKGLTPRIRFESVLSGYLTELNGKYKLRVTELTLEPGGYVGEHNHVGPGIRMMTLGEMTYVLPDKTTIYKAGDFFFESGDVNHTVYNKTDKPNQHLLFEILPADLKGPSLMPVKKL
jgi:quercetin dioxygenase-like cupin family protein